MQMILFQVRDRQIDFLIVVDDVQDSLGLADVADIAVGDRLKFFPAFHTFKTAHGRHFVFLSKTLFDFRRICPYYMLWIHQMEYFLKMLSFKGRWLPGLMLLLLLTGLNTASGDSFPPTYIYKIAPGQPFFKFDFEDLAKHRWYLPQLYGKAVIIITAHRDIRYDMEKWAKALLEEYEREPNLQLLWVVNLSEFPWEKLHERADDYWQDFRAPIPCILDWHAQIGRALRIAYRTPNIIGIDAAGRLAFHLTGPCTAKFLPEVTARIQELLGKNGKIKDRPKFPQAP